ncbi:MAG: extracellular solute-binding protein [Planctomycetota bacterium]
MATRLRFRAAHRATALCACLAALLLAGCGSSNTGGGAAGSPAASGSAAAPAAHLRLVIYTSHGAEQIVPCIARFKKAHPEIDVVEPLDMGATELAERIRGEAANPQCDVWWGGPHYDFIDAASRGLLQPYRPTWAAHSPADRHDPHGFWYGQYLTPEVIMYNTRVIPNPADAPQDWDDLLLPQWKNKIVIRDPPASGTMKAIFAAMIWRAGGLTDSPEKGFDWLRRLDANTAHYAADPDRMYQALNTPDTPVTVWNMADAYIQHTVNKYPFGFILPKSGTPVLVEGIAIPKGAPDPEAAKIFYEFITSKEEMIFQANKLNRIPARDDIPPDRLPKWMTDQPIKAFPIDWSKLAPKATEWMDIWDRTIRTAK